MNSRRWKRARATVELCAPRRRYRDGTHINHRERYRYAITVTYPVAGDLYVTDVVSNTPLQEGSKVVVRYDPLNPRINSLNHPPRERKALLIVASCAGVVVLILLAIAFLGL